DVVAPEQLRGALRRKLVARAMKTISPHPGFMPRWRDRVAGGRLRHPLVERRFEEGYQRHARQLLAKTLDAERVGGVVRGGDFTETFQRLDHAIVGRHTARQVPAEHGLEA